MKIHAQKLAIAFALCSILTTQLFTVCAQGTAFMYQGQLNNNGSPANGSYDLVFSLYATNANGVAIAGPVTNSATSVTNGLFTTVINFGAGIFNGSNYWLDVSVRTNNVGPFAELAPRQPVLPTPYAIFANTASNVNGTISATQLSGILPAAQLPAGVITNGASGVNLTGVFSGNGGGITNVNALSLGGSELALSANGVVLGTNFNANAKPILLRSPGDFNHGVGYATSTTNFIGLNPPDGPMLWGFGGGALGSMNGSPRLALVWTTSGVGIGVTNPATALQVNGTVTAAVFSGNGAGLTNITAVQLNSAVVTNTEAGVTLSNLTVTGNLLMGAASGNIPIGSAALANNTSGTNNLAMGIGALQNNTGGNNNVAIGPQALAYISGGGANIALGYQAGSALGGSVQNDIDIGTPGVSGDSGIIRLGTPGLQTATYLAGTVFVSNLTFTSLTLTNTTGNVALGTVALISDTTGTNNVAIGAGALLDNQSGINNVAVGDQALAFLNSGSGNNIALGYQAGSALSGAAQNDIDIGNPGALSPLGFGGENGVIRIGTSGLQSATYLAGTVFVSGLNLSNTTDNVSLGTSALIFDSTGTNNVAIGAYALQQNMSGANNVAIGYQAGSALFSGAQNDIDIGNPGVSGDNRVIRIGTPGVQTNTYLAGTVFVSSLALSNTTGNVSFGTAALISDTFGTNNIAIGADALQANQLANDNVAVGDHALANLSSGNGTNIALGYEAGSALIYGQNDIDIGNPGVQGDIGTIRIGTPGIHINTYLAGTVFVSSLALTNTTGNVSFGTAALISDTIGTNNIAIGADALNANTAADGNVAIGYQALANLNFGNGTNIALGYQAGSAMTFGQNDIDIGNPGVTGDSGIIRIGTPGIHTATYLAGTVFLSSLNLSNTTGNVSFGTAALISDTAGTNNIAIGADALNANTAVNDNVAIGYQALANLNFGNGTNIALGYQAGSAMTFGQNDIDIGNPGVTGDSGIIRIGTPGVHTNTYLAGNVYASGAVFSNGVDVVSDRYAKENFASVNTRAILAKVTALPVTEWNYKTSKDAEHIGPMAQDFQAAFRLNGGDDKHISVLDEGGVALAAIQGLNQKLDEKDGVIQQQTAEIADLKARLEKIERLLSSAK